MALEIKGMKRVFKMKKNSQEIVLDDPNVNMSPAEVMDFYSMNYPELTTATVHGPEIEDDRAVYEFSQPEPFFPVFQQGKESRVLGLFQRTAAKADT